MRTLARAELSLPHEAPAPAVSPRARAAVAPLAHDTVRGAAQAVVDELAGWGLMPSVYVEVDGRLRCQAVRGYWQIFDGMPPGAGLIGTAYRTGVEQLSQDVPADPRYLTAVEGVVAELCVPLHARGRVVGVLNVESRSAITEAEQERVRVCAAQLERFIADGAEAPPAPAQRLARRAARLAHLTSPSEIIAEAVDAACWVSGLSTATLVLADPHGELHVCAAIGPFASIAAELHPDELGRMAGWVENGTSSYTVGSESDPGFAGHEPLRAAGARTVVVLPLAASGRRLGYLALIDGAAHDLRTEDVELLELLATQVAAGLRVSSAVSELRERVGRDPLTGLGHHATFYDELATALTSDRRVAVMLADLDGFKALNDSCGHRAGDAALRAMAELLSHSLPPDATAHRIGGDEFAVLFRDGGGPVARQVAEAVRAGAPEAFGLTVSIGVAQALPGERDSDLMDRADAALYAVKRRGRDGIEVAGREIPAAAWQVRLF